MPYESFPPPIQPGEQMASTATGASKWLGATRTDLDYNWGASGVKTIRSYRSVTRKFVLNDSGITILPKMGVVLDETGTKIKGYCRLGTHAGGSERFFLVDEFLPAAGVANGAYCWIVIDGPAMAITSVTADDENNIALGGRLISCTAAASTHSTTAGRVAITEGATSVLALELHHSVGRALTAKTTAQTNADILVEVGRLL